MTQLSSFLAGFALSAGLIVAIGAQNAFVLRQGLQGTHIGIVVAFCATVDFILIAAGVSGLGTAVSAAPWLVQILALGGALFLASYGALALCRALRPAALAAAPEAAPTRRAALAQVAGFTLLNPHVYLDTVFLAGSIGAAQPPGTETAFILGAGVASAGWFSALGYGARRLAPVFARPAAWRIFDLAIAVIMFAMAAGLLRYATA